MAAGAAADALFTYVRTDNQFFTEITWLAAAGVSTGWRAADNSAAYQPVAPANRDAMAAFLYRFDGSPNFTPPAASPFRDVTPATQFYKEMTWLAAAGISTGWAVPGGKEYHPFLPVNRDAMAAFMSRLAAGG